jgi:hypothetical protein
MRDTGGTLRYTSRPSTYQYSANATSTGTAYCAAAGSNASGIVIGTGTDAEDELSYALVSIIDHSAGGGESGKMYYDQSETPVKSWDSVNLKLDVSHSRQFTNNSGDTVTIGEIGLITKICVGSQYSILTARDKLDPSVDVDDGLIYRVTYTIRVHS